MNDTTHGDLIIKFKIDFPKKLSDEWKKYLDKILIGSSLSKEELKLDEIKDDVEVKQATIDTTDYTSHRRGKYTEDEEDDVELVDKE